MKVVFCLYGDMKDEAKMMVRSCRRLGYEIWQLTDETTDAIDGVDVVVRKPKDVPQVLYRYRHLADVEPPYLSLDADVLVLQDVSDGMDGDFDVVLTHRTHYDMPYNGGVFFVKTRGFIEECVHLIEHMPPERQDWTGGQIAMRIAAESGKFRVKELPCSIWNNSDNVKTGPIKPSVRILHFKGQKRRKFMRAAYDNLFPRR